MYKKLDEIVAYKIASDLSDNVWEAVDKWKWLGKTTVGT
jgi:hypothetical protein